MTLRNKVFKIKLQHGKEYVRKLVGRNWYEVVIGIGKHGRIWVSILFR